MGLKTFYYFGLLILPNIILGQQLNSTIGMEKELMPNSLQKECYSGPIVWSNCHTGEFKFPMVNQL